MTAHDKRLATMLAALAVDTPVMVVGCDDGLGSDQLTRALAEAKNQGVEVVIIEEVQAPKIEDLVLTMKFEPAYEMPVLPDKPKEWWRGGNPKRRRSA